MSTCSTGKSSSAFDKLFNQILKYIGARTAEDCTVLGYFHYFIKKPRGSRSQVTAIEIKNDNFRFADEYEITTALKIASEYLRKSRYFIISEVFGNWSEITKAEFKALGLLDTLEIYDRVEYDYEHCEVVLTRKNSKATCFNVNTIDEFLQIVDAMDGIKNGNFYTRIKEAKHE